ncbi:hypothetical protein BCR39DRAFT_541958 [Naematelia encephala]|uniref:F-box domain-containing protein n=1 Tax=Naematelia encephala TaxID=71784 RepID=A0A1Y2AW65_9TREE|nr:hypothetical protein BCR39DRAFT_541958 [Naematelia encephala]
MSTAVRSPRVLSDPSSIPAEELEKLSLVTRSSQAVIDDAELERFRREWRNEVQSRRDVPAVPPSPARKGTEIEAQAPKSPEKKARDPVSPTTRKAPLAREVDAASSSSSSQTIAAVPRLPRSTVERGDVRVEAVRLYARAVEDEQSGKLNDALKLYRRAFKMDDNVDRLYARSTNKTLMESPGVEIVQIPTPSSTDIVSASPPAEEPYTFQRHLQMQPDYEKALHHPTNTSSIASSSSRPSPLTALFSGLPVPVSEYPFLPADENLPLPLARLPAELLTRVFDHLDVTSLERFARTCWRARYLTATSDVWRRVAQSIYRPPAMVPPSWRARDVVQRHRGEWRTMLLEEDRVRLDGCYIAVCHYVRPGAGDEWVTVTHMITYHRFLRFYPDGSVISFLTTDHPSDIVPRLRPSLRGKGLHFGRWHLVRSDTKNPSESALPLPSTVSGDRRARIVISDLLEPGNEVPKYEFAMDLALCETGRGK